MLNCYSYAIFFLFHDAYTFLCRKGHRHQACATKQVFYFRCIQLRAKLIFGTNTCSIPYSFIYLHQSGFSELSLNAVKVYDRKHGNYENDSTNSKLKYSS